MLPPNRTPEKRRQANFGGSITDIMEPKTSMKLFGVYDRVDSGELDEVWIFTGPMIGAFPYETRMIGRGAYWCNSPGLEKDCRPFIVYGFNYERGVGEMLEDAGHRAESILSSIFGRPDYDWGNTNFVYSTCDDWSNYPDMHSEPSLVNCTKWGNGDIRLHHKWWFSHFPHVTGVNAKTGMYNNWWIYFTLDYLDTDAP